MANSQTEQILMMKARGYGYKKIAKELDISENTVKSVLRRKSDTPRCKNCSAVLYNTAGHRQKTFCSAKCRYAYWIKNNCSRSTVKSVCLNCGAEFSDYAYRKRKFCSHNCYILNRCKGENGHETE